MNKKLIPNSTQVPNDIIDFLLPRIPSAELKCMLYICRRTFGFHKEEDRISFSQFINGIKGRDGKRLDYGTGLARPSVSEALKNLRQSNAIFVEKDSKGNYYKVNLEMDIDKVVKKVNQLRKLTNIGKESEPKLVKLLNLQKKGNKGKKEEGFSLFKRKKKPFYNGMEMRNAQGKWWCIPQEGGQWLLFAGLEEDIIWQ